MTRCFAALCIAMVVMGCREGETSHPPTAERAVSSKPSAARMYQTAEAMAADGHYADAVRLARHSILSLPRTADNDELRHALILRMAYLQLLTAQVEQDAAYAQDAATMLLAYGQRHEALFSPDRGEERDAIYELLYEAETLAERLQQPAPASASAPVAAVVPEVVDTPPDAHAGEELEAKMEREVHVRRAWFYDEDDPMVRSRLESSFSGAMGYDFLTTPGVAVLSGPRPMVRRGRPVESVPLQGGRSPSRRGLQTLSRAVLSSSRPALRNCFREAASRAGVLQAEATVEVSITPVGETHNVAVVEGELIDAIGDVCVIEELDRVMLAVGAPSESVRIRLPLRFFYDGPDLMSEGKDGGPKSIPHPEIDDFAFSPLGGDDLRPFSR